MFDVRELVRQHACQLVVVEDLEDAFGGGDRRVLRIASRGERVGRRLRNDVHPRHRQPGALREMRHDPVQAMVRADLLRSVAAQDDLVGPEVRDEVRHDGEQEADDKALSAANQLADEQKEPGHETEQQRCFDCVRHDSSMPFAKRPYQAGH